MIRFYVVSTHGRVQSQLFPLTSLSVLMVAFLKLEQIIDILFTKSRISKGLERMETEYIHIRILYYIIRNSSSVLLNIYISMFKFEYNVQSRRQNM